MFIHFMASDRRYKSSCCFNEHLIFCFLSLCTSFILSHQSCFLFWGSGSILPDSVSWIGIWLVLPTGPGNPPAVRMLSGGSVRFGSRPSQKPNPPCLGAFVTRPRHRTVGIWPGWNRTTVQNICFLLLWLQLSIRLIIVSWHSQHINCSPVVPLPPPAFQFAIRLIFVEWLWNNVSFWPKLPGFRSQLNEYLTDRKSESGRSNCD